ncbi:hypothetical protein [Natrinema salaciae]|uniref:Uncharacterized protein n=1 Tax=Natrinema salaciae TaxID=1186196 RepID=A0A1H9P420_9EURY|nr:hypothetical protein [Natrinema salaciae]SER42922.1 hypothetical protein SAMN04489841_3854 [Natrinema salaciae]
MSDDLFETTETTERVKELVASFKDGTAGDAEFEALRELLSAEDALDRDGVLYGIRSVGILDEERTDAAVDVLLGYCFDQPRKVREVAAESLSDIGCERTARITGSQYDVAVDARYIDNGADYLNYHKVTDLSKGAAGEKIAETNIRTEIASKIDEGEKVDDYIYKGYDPGTVNDNGPDLVYKDPEGDLIIDEVKFLSDDGNFGKRNLGKTKDGDVTQMSDQWIRNVLSEERGIDKSTREAIEDARATGDVRREITVIQNRPKDGKTVTKSINELGIDEVRLIKIGEQR